jgi:hypothetical protein
MKIKIFYCATLLVLKVAASDFDTSLGSLQNQLEGLSLAFTPFPGITLTSEDPKDDWNIYLLKDTVVPAAPKQESLEAFARTTGIRVIQLVVAWQDLTVNSFVYGNDSLTNCIKNVPQNSELRGHLEKQQKITESILGESIGGGYASCGYHTVAHLDTIANYLLSKEPWSNLTNLVHINALFGIKNICDLGIIDPCGTWRNALMGEQQNRVGGGSKLCDAEGEWISHEAMLMLAEKTNLKKTGIIYSKTGVPGQIQPTTKKIIDEAVKTAPDKNYLFFWINSGAHWYGICIIVSQKLCLIVDSKNSPRYDDESTKAILQAVFKEQEVRINNSWRYLESFPIIIHGFDSEKITLNRVLALSVLEKFIDEGLLKDAFKSLYELTDNELAFIFENFVYFAPLKKGEGGETKLTLAQFIQAYKKAKAGKEVSNISYRFQVMAASS